MDITVLHLHDDVEAARLLRLYEFSYPNLRIHVTPKYGKFDVNTVRKYLDKSSVVVLFIFDQNVSFDERTELELKEAIKLRKPIVVVAPSNFDIPNFLLNYDNVKIYAPSKKYILEFFERSEQKGNTLDLLIYKLLSEIHLRSKVA
ncbi:MAG: hypothetical protein GXO48_02410 [Chlorobi bacterium]|nr:hypothetical protein [Chlorobiota bacterium]